MSVEVLMSIRVLDHEGQNLTAKVPSLTGRQARTVEMFHGDDAPNAVRALEAGADAQVIAFVGTTKKGKLFVRIVDVA